MAEPTMLERVKNALGVTGEYQDGTIQEYKKGKILERKTKRP